VPTHAERRKLPYTPEQMFDLVADIDSYSKFLPWCVASRVRRRNGDVLHADLVIGFKMFREKYTSKVTLQPHDRIDVEYLQGPFKYLNNHWVFEPTEDGGTFLDFFVDFEFRSALLQKMIGVVFNEAVKLMVGAFETRAHEVYGEPVAAADSKQPNG
tara:strand:- start:63425 stop:63895 length:471 start_codon:yes stop_codon:yes gene_type:complete